MKYNRSEIMRRAWAIRKSENVTMSAALVKAWAEAKAGAKKAEIVARLEKIVAIGNEPKNGYHYTLSSKDWANYGKNRTYFEIIETREGTRHYKKGNYGYFDNLANEYFPVKDINWDFGGNNRIA